MGAGAAVAVHRGQQAMRPASGHTGTGAAGRAGHGGAGRSDVAGAGPGAADIRSERLSPCPEGSRRWAGLVATGVRGLLAGRGTAVRVDQMSPEQARALLTSGLPQLDPAVADGLLAVTGR